MKGKRWRAVLEGYRRCLKKLQGMENIIVSTVSFDNKANIHGKEKTVVQAQAVQKSIPFTKGGTSYQIALEVTLDIISTGLSSKFANYLSVILFLSDGVGNYPKAEIARINELKKNEKKIMFYTIACETEEDEDMMNMTKALQGEHYQVKDAEAIKNLFQRIISS